MVLHSAKSVPLPAWCMTHYSKPKITAKQSLHSIRRGTHIVWATHSAEQFSSSRQHLTQTKCLASQPLMKDILTILATPACYYTAIKQHMHHIHSRLEIHQWMECRILRTCMSHAPIQAYNTVASRTQVHKAQANGSRLAKPLGHSVAATAVQQHPVWLCIHGPFKIHIRYTLCCGTYACL